MSNTEITFADVAEYLNDSSNYQVRETKADRLRRLDYEAMLARNHALCPDPFAVFDM